MSYPEASDAATLIEGARRDLSYAKQLLGGGGDRLVAIAAVARAARRADDATVALLEEPRSTRPKTRTKYPLGV